MALDTADHAPELAGFAAIVALVVPWSISASSGAFSGFVVFRFVFGSVRFVFGSRAADVEWAILSVTELSTFYSGDLARVATLWFVAAALLIVVLLLGFSLLVAGERLATPLDPVRIMGALCLCMALSLSGATWLLWQNSSRTPIPVGVVILSLFGAGLLTIDRNRGRRTAVETSG